MRVPSNFEVPVFADTAGIIYRSVDCLYCTNGSKNNEPVPDYGIKLGKTDCRALILRCRFGGVLLHIYRRLFAKRPERLDLRGLETVFLIVLELRSAEIPLISPWSLLTLPLTQAV